MLVSIRAKVVASQIILIVLVTVLMGVTGYLIMKDHLLGAEREKLEFIARGKAEETGRRLSGVRQRMEAMSTDAVLEVYAHTLKESILIEHFARYAEDFSVISLSDFDGTEALTLSDGVLTGDRGDMSDTETFQDAIWFPNRTFVSSVGPGTGGKPVTVLAVSRQTYFGEQIGVIVAESPLSAITEGIRGFQVGQTGYIVLVDGGGRILSHPDESRILEQLQGDGYIMVASQRGQAGFHHTTVMGQDSLVAIEPVDGTDWALMAVLPYKEFIKGPVMLRNTIAAAAAAILVAFGVLALWAAGSVTRTLRELTEAAGAIAKGDLKRKVHVRSQDEAGVLSESFNKMVQDLSRARDDLMAAKDEAETSREHLMRLSSHMMTMLEEERSRISHSVHDELGQLLSTLKIELSWLGKRLPPENEELKEKSSSMLSLIDSTIDTVQNITAELRPPVLDDLGLAAAIELEAGEFEERTGILCAADLPPGEFELDGDVAASVYRVFQEALVNVARHAGASKVTVSLGMKGGTLDMTVSDNGSGITGEQVDSPTSYGLMGMRERMRAIGGTVSFSGRRGEGTEVSVSVPLGGVKKEAR